MPPHLLAPDLSCMQIEREVMEQGPRIMQTMSCVWLEASICRNAHLVEQAQIESILSCSIARHPAALFQQLVWAVQAGEMLLKGVHVIQRVQMADEGISWGK